MKALWPIRSPSVQLRCCSVNHPGEERTGAGFDLIIPVVGQQQFPDVEGLISHPQFLAQPAGGSSSVKRRVAVVPCLHGDRGETEALCNQGPDTLGH